MNRLCMFSTIFNNIIVHELKSASISWMSVLLVEQTRVPGENHPHALSWKIIKKNIKHIQTFPQPQNMGASLVCTLLSHDVINISICKSTRPFVLLITYVVFGNK